MLTNVEQPVVVGDQFTLAPCAIGKGAGDETSLVDLELQATAVRKFR